GGRDYLGGLFGAVALAYLPVIQVLLSGVIPVAGGEIYRQALGLGALGKAGEGLGDTGVHNAVIGQGGGFRRGKVLIHAVILVHQYHFPAGEVHIRQVAARLLGGDRGGLHGGLGRGLGCRVGLGRRL